MLLGGGALVYAATHSLFNVEGGHRAIVFNRLVGIKEKVQWLVNKGGMQRMTAKAAHVHHQNVLFMSFSNLEYTSTGVRGRHTFDGTMV